jgi:hypothetical protein
MVFPENGTGELVEKQGFKGSGEKLNLPLSYVHTLPQYLKD